MKFKVGDIIRGIDMYRYMWTDIHMNKAEVLKIINENEMEIKVIEHNRESVVGNTYTVLNDEKYFALVELRKISRDELLKMPAGTKITTDKGIVLIKDDVEGEHSRFENESLLLKDYNVNDDLTVNNDDIGNKIVKIEEPTYKTIWYEEKEEIAKKEMTIEQIEKELGYSIKIIKEAD